MIYRVLYKGKRVGVEVLTSRNIGKLTAFELATGYCYDRLGHHENAARALEENEPYAYVDDEGTPPY